MPRLHGKYGTYTNGCRCELCLEANREHYRNYKPSPAAKKHRSEYEKRYKREKKLERRAFLDSKKSMPCIDCGQTFPPVCMDFDHIPERGPREFWLSHWVHREMPMHKLESEIAKCEVVCACCHRLRTQARQKAGKPTTHLDSPTNAQ